MKQGKNGNLHPDYAECRLEEVKGNLGENAVEIRYYCTADNEEDYERHKEFLQDYKRLKSSYLVELRKCELSKVKRHCSENYIVNTTWEFSNHTLETEISYRRQTNQKFTEDEVGSVYYSSLRAISDLHKAELQHGCLRPTYIIFLHKGQTSVKILPNMRGIVLPFISAQRLVQAAKLDLFVSPEIKNLLMIPRGPRGEGQYPKGDFEALIDIIEKMPKEKEPTWLLGVKKEVKNSPPLNWYLGSRLLKAYQGETVQDSNRSYAEFVRHLNISTPDYTAPAETHQSSADLNRSSKLIFTDAREDIPESVYQFQRLSLDQDESLRKPIRADQGITPFSPKFTDRPDYPQTLEYRSSFVPKGRDTGSRDKPQRSDRSNAHSNQGVVIRKHEGLLELNLTEELEEDQNYSRLPLNSTTVDVKRYDISYRHDINR